MSTAYLSLGSNEGDRLGWMDQTIKLLSESCGNITAKSSVYETAAWGITEQPDFLNMVLQMETGLSPDDLIAAILDTEVKLGRHRDVKWGPRIIDIDILFYDQLIVNKPGLTIPHPFIQNRRFILVPMAEINPKFQHPVFHKSASELLAVCDDLLEVHRYSRD